MAKKSFEEIRHGTRPKPTFEEVSHGMPSSNRLKPDIDVEAEKKRAKIILNNSQKLGISLDTAEESYRALESISPGGIVSVPVPEKETEAFKEEQRKQTQLQQALVRQFEREEKRRQRIAKTADTFVVTPFEVRTKPTPLDRLKAKARADEAYRRRYELVQRKFKGFWDELAWQSGGAVINQIGGAIGALSAVSDSAMWDRQKLQDVSLFLRDLAGQPEFQRGKGGGFRNYIAMAIGQVGPYAGASALAAYLTGTPLAVGGVSFTVEGGNDYISALQAGGTHEEALMGMWVTGTIVGVLETLQFEKLIKFMPTGPASRKAVKKAINSSVWDKILMHVARGGELTAQTLMFMHVEGTVEALQEIPSLWSESRFRDVQFTEAFSRVVQAYGLGATGFGVIGGVKATSVRAFQSLRRIENKARFIKQLMDDYNLSRKDAKQAIKLYKEKGPEYGNLYIIAAKNLPEEAVREAFIEPGEKERVRSSLEEFGIKPEYTTELIEETRLQNYFSDKWVYMLEKAGMTPDEITELFDFIVTEDTSGNYETQEDLETVLEAVIEGELRLGPKKPTQLSEEDKKRVDDLTFEKLEEALVKRNVSPEIIDNIVKKAQDWFERTGTSSISDIDEAAAKNVIAEDLNWLISKIGRTNATAAINAMLTNFAEGADISEVAINMRKAMLANKMVAEEIARLNEAEGGTQAAEPPLEGEVIQAYDDGISAIERLAKMISDITGEAIVVPEELPQGGSQFGVQEFIYPGSFEELSTTQKSPAELRIRREAERLIEADPGNEDLKQAIDAYDNASLAYKRLMGRVRSTSSAKEVFPPGQISLSDTARMAEEFIDNQKFSNYSYNKLSTLLGENQIEELQKEIVTHLLKWPDAGPEIIEGVIEQYLLDATGLSPGQLFMEDQPPTARGQTPTPSDVSEYGLPDQRSEQEIFSQIAGIIGESAIDDLSDVEIDEIISLEKQLLPLNKLVRTAEEILANKKLPKDILDIFKQIYPKEYVDEINQGIFNWIEENREAIKDVKTIEDARNLPRDTFNDLMDVLAATMYGGSGLSIEELFGSDAHRLPIEEKFRGFAAKPPEDLMSELEARTKFLTRFMELSERVARAEKTPGRQLIEEERGLLAKDWKAFWRQRGYTEEEIADYEARIEMVREGERYGFSKDQLFEIEKQIQDRLYRERDIRPAEPRNIEVVDKEEIKNIIVESGEAIKNSRTGKPFRARLLRGEAESGIPYSVGLHGEGKYYTDSLDLAKHYGAVKVYDIILNNPFVANTGGEFEAKIEEIGGPKPLHGPMMDEYPTREHARAVTDLLKSKGYDGVIIRESITYGVVRLSEVIKFEEHVDFEGKTRREIERQKPSDQIKNEDPEKNDHRGAGFMYVPPISAVGQVEEDHPNTSIERPKKDTNWLQRYLLHNSNQALNSGNPNVIAAAEEMVDRGMVMNNETMAELTAGDHMYRKLPAEYRANKGEKFFDLMDQYYAPDKIKASDLPDAVKEVLTYFKREDQAMRLEAISRKRKMVVGMVKAMTVLDIMARLEERKIDGYELRISQVAGQDVDRIYDTAAGRFVSKDEIALKLARDIIPDDWGREWSHIYHTFFGQWQLEWRETDPETGEVERHFIGRAETQNEAAKKLRDWVNAQRADGREDVDDLDIVATPDIMIPYDVLRLGRKHFFALEKLLKEAADIESSAVREAVRGILGLKESKQKFLPSLLYRKGAPGYSKDFRRVWTAQVTQFQRWKHLTEMNRIVEPLIELIKSQGYPGWAAHLENTKDFLWGRARPQYAKDLDNIMARTPVIRNFVKPYALERWVGIGKTINYWRHLQTVRFAAVNSLQLAQTLYPVVGAAGVYRGTQLYYSKEGQDLLRRHHVGGTASKLHELGMRPVRRFERFTPAGHSEIRNQSIAFLALYDRGIRMGMSETEAARYGRLRGQVFTQFAHSPGNVPGLMRDPIGGLVLQYKGFPIHNLELVSRLMREGDYGGVARWVGALLLIGGTKTFLNVATGIPGMGYLTYKLYKKIKDEYGEEIADFIHTGLPSLVGIDLSGSVTPIDVPYGETLTDKIGNVVLGPTGTTALKIYRDSTRTDIAKDIGTAQRALKSFVDSSGTLKQFTYLVKALQKDTTNYDAKQRYQYRLEVWDLWKKAFGFRAADETRQRIVFEAMMDLNDEYNAQLDRIALAVIDGDRAEATRLISEWNAMIPEAPVTATSIRGRVLSRKLLRELPLTDRALQTLPKHLQGIFVDQGEEVAPPTREELDEIFRRFEQERENQ